MEAYVKTLTDEALAAVIRRWVAAARWYGEHDEPRWKFARESLIRAITHGYTEQAARLERAVPLLAA